ncbi:type IV pilus assembly protein PilM [Candidatus Nomurabacteria bacterium]|nr:type IV pilus assembly protein PilM [Candidatus Nomurabacteria bacterium]
MKSSIFNAVGEFFALDIGSSAIRVVQLRGSGTNRTLIKHGAAPINVQMALSDAQIDRTAVGAVITKLLGESDITAKNVVVGLPANKTFVTVVDLPKMSPQEMASTIKYQADQYIPMAVDDAKIDWSVLGDSPEEAGKTEVLLASVANEFSEKRMELLESIGLNVIGLEPESLAIARSLTPSSGAQSAQMILDMGEYATDIVMTFGGAPRLVRSIPTGAQSLLKSAKQNLNIDDNQSRQFVYKFGFDKTKLEGQIFKSLEPTAQVIVTEIQKSMKFFTNRYKNTQLSGIVTSGAAALLPGFHQYISEAAGGIPVQAGNCWQNVSYSNSSHEQLMSVNHQFAVAVGLALRSGL